MLFLLIFLLILLLLGTALFSSSETAFFSLSPMQVARFKQSKNSNDTLVAKLLDSPRDLLITIIMANVMMGILIQNVVSNMFGVFSGWLLNVGLPLVLTLVIGDFIPKSVGIANNKRLAPKVARPLSVIHHLLYPVRKVLTRITSFIFRLLFFYLQEEQEISTDELQHVLRRSRVSGVLAEDEAELMLGYLTLQESTAKGLMRPREEVLYFEMSDPLSRLIHLFVDQECTRIPVCDKKMDNVIGIISSGQFFLHREKLENTRDLLPLLTKPYFVPESTSAQILLEQMYDEKQSLAIVVDEYGAFSGLLALEDLVEAVVGEIIDRRDEKAHYTRSGDDVVIASGKLELAEFESLFDVELPSNYNMITLGGWLTEQIGDIPPSGHKYHWGNFQFHILSSDPKRVRRVYIRRLKER